MRPCAKESKDCSAASGVFAAAVPLLVGQCDGYHDSDFVCARVLLIRERARGHTYANTPPTRDRELRRRPRRQRLGQRADGLHAASGRSSRSQDNIDNPHLGEYVGLPLSREAIRRAEIWDASIQSLPEWQCRPHSAAYIKRGPSNLRVWKEVDPASRQIIAFQTEWLRSTNTPIYMDGRPHPPEYAAHTWGGFSTGAWEGDRLRVQDHAHEGRLLPPQRRAAERQSDADRVSDAAAVSRTRTT